MALRLSILHFSNFRFKIFKKKTDFYIFIKYKMLTSGKLKTAHFHYYLYNIYL